MLSDCLYFCSILEGTWKVSCDVTEQSNRRLIRWRHRVEQSRS